MKLRTARAILAALFWVGITLLFLDFKGVTHAYLGWMAKVQFFPALLAANVVVVGLLVALTLLFGRLYCSVICPLGVYQDAVSRLSSKVKRNRFRHSAAKAWLRYTVLGIFIVASVVGAGSLVALLEPYSAYGRIINTHLQPLYQWGNNLLAQVAERADSYAFYKVEVWMKGVGTLIIASVTLVVVSLLAWRGGRTYCNTICPVGTILGLMAKFSRFKVRFDKETCDSCGLCARNCKSSCIDAKNQTIDYTRCVSCFNCMGVCKKKSMVYTLPNRATTVAEKSTKEPINESRRAMLAVTGALVAAATVKAQEMKMDGGWAYIEDMQIPNRQTPIVPPGAKSLRRFARHCTACQLCVSACPNQVLRPATNLIGFMQPEMSYERGYCRPECTKCSEVCPTGAIKRIDTAEKSAIQIGHAVWIEKNCVVLTDNVLCGNCARHCPVGAIQMIPLSADGFDERTTPHVNTERCIGCGACENLCPARPFSAIYVEGHKMHREV